ncbi:hypothetical protein HAX54_039422, partial [Datura stramonium]|nr:hypothetical protein [Datura stramonium]
KEKRRERREIWWLSGGRFVGGGGDACDAVSGEGKKREGVGWWLFVPLEQRGIRCGGFYGGVRPEAREFRGEGGFRQVGGDAGLVMFGGREKRWRGRKERRSGGSATGSRPSSPEKMREGRGR